MHEMPVFHPMPYSGFGKIKSSSSESSSRGITRKGFCYHDIIMLVRWDQDGKPKIQMDLKREYAEVIYKSQNPVLCFVAIALASRAFKDHDTVHEIFYLEAPHYNRLILEWAAHILYMPIPRAPTSAGLSRMFQEPILYSGLLRGVFRRSGHKRAAISNCRRECLIYPNDRAYSKAELMKFAGYKPIDSYLAYSMEGNALSHEFSRDQFQIGERNLTTANPKKQSPIGSAYSREFLLPTIPRNARLPLTRD